MVSGSMGSMTLEVKTEEENSLVRSKTVCNESRYVITERKKSAESSP